MPTLGPDGHAPGGSQYADSPHRVRGAFNRHDRRAGHLFQGRYRLIVVEEEPYFLELVRYIDLNPLRARHVGISAGWTTVPLRGPRRADESGRPALARHGRGAGRYGSRPTTARRPYRAFVAEGLGPGRRPEFQGGGLLRSLGGWQDVRALRRGRETYTADEQVVGTGAFVEGLLGAMERQARHDRRAVLVNKMTCNAT